MQDLELRLALIKEYESAPDNALFSQLTIAAIRHCSLATIERERWAGTGIPFIKFGRLVRYRKVDIQQWLAKHRVVCSTLQAQTLAQLTDENTNNGDNV